MGLGMMTMDRGNSGDDDDGNGIDDTVGHGVGSLGALRHFRSVSRHSSIPPEAAWRQGDSARALADHAAAGGVFRVNVPYLELRGVDYPRRRSI